MRKPVFLEDWWLDAVAEGNWRSVEVVRAGRVEGKLPFVLTRNMHFSRCGLPPLGRLMFPLIDVAAKKRETLERARFRIEDELIAGLPKAHAYHFVLPPDAGNTLAWQAHGFTARVQHTFIIDPDRSEAQLWNEMRDKTRNIIRRAQEHLAVKDAKPESFVDFYEGAYGDTLDEEHCQRVARLAEAAVSRAQGRALAAVDAAGVTHAAALFVWDSTDYYFYLAARTSGHGDIGALSLVVWNAMLDATGRGLRFDFDGVSSRNRLRFMQPFGGRLANRIVLERGSLIYDTRLMLRRFRKEMAAGAAQERFY